MRPQGPGGVTTIATTTQREPRSIVRVVVGWLVSDKKLPILVRLSAIFGFFWGLLQVANNFKISVIPDNWRGLVVYCLISVSAFLAVELLILNATRPRPEAAAANDPEQVFAAGLINYARSLAAEGQYKDQAILELRSWSSRLLHLMGAEKERTELGQIALTAAGALQDRQTQASILIDDLGWSLYKAGDASAAEDNIEEALRIIDEVLSNDPDNSTYVSLKAKAIRHLSNIRADRLALTEARKQFIAAREVADRLTGVERDHHVAQLQHSEAEVILNDLERDLTPSGQIDPSGRLATLLYEAIALAEDAEKTFNSLGDAEREAKVLKVRVQLLAHDTRKQKYREAATRLSRLERQVARDLR